MKAKPYVGMNKFNGRFEVFMSATKPGPSLAYKYTHTHGPFRSKRGAAYYAKYGHANSFCKTIADAERLGKVLEELNDVNA